MTTTPTDDNRTHQPDSPESPSAVDSAKESVKTVAQTSAEETKAVVEEAKEHARDLVGDAREQVRNQADDQSRRLASTLRDLSAQFTSMSSQGASSGTAVALARQAAQRTDQLATRLETGGIGGVMDDLRRLGRNRPGAFLLGAAGAGFVIGRVVKNADTKALASAAKPTSSSNADRAWAPTPAAPLGTPARTWPTTTGLEG
jgi:cell division septum initiation protein DivIVA